VYSVYYVAVCQQSQYVTPSCMQCPTSRARLDAVFDV
jgi:hypothetical protein